MINIQKYYSVHISLIRSTFVHFSHFGSIQSTLVLFGPQQSYSTHISPIQSNLFTWSYLVHIGPIRSNCSYSVYIGPLCPIQFTLVLFSPPCFHSVHFVSFGQFVFTSAQFCTLANRGKYMFRLRVSILSPNLFYIYISNS